MGEDVGEKAPDEERVLLLGDSFTEADQVTGEQRFSDLVDKRLRAETASSPKHVRVLNGGIQNGAPSQYILQLRKWLPKLKPDVVVVALAPNDINDDLLFERFNGFTFDADGAPLALKAQTPPLADAEVLPPSVLLDLPPARRRGAGHELLLPSGLAGDAHRRVEEHPLQRGRDRAGDVPEEDGQVPAPDQGDGGGERRQVRRVPDPLHVDVRQRAVLRAALSNVQGRDEASAMRRTAARTTSSSKATSTRAE